jgi:pyrroloquinoline quinone biosynthesis protein B
MALHVIVLGSAAGGGFPQWNCGCANCAAVRTGAPGFSPRTEDSLAVSADGERWFLINASPEVLRQIQENRELWPRRLRDSPIAGVVLTNGDLDHVLGLLQLREAQRFSIYATARVQAGLRENAATRTLERFQGQVRWQTLRLGEACELETADRAPSGISLTAHAVMGKPPLHLAECFAPSAEDNVALRLSALGGGGGTLVYASAIADARGAQAVLDDCSVLLMDGTFWSETELPGLGIAMGPAKSMAHQPIGGPAGSLEALRALRARRRIYTHVNNTNPVLDEASAERSAVLSAGWEVAVDGLRFSVDD